MTTLYHHKTDGGAEYLCAAPIEGTNEGDLSSVIVRLDGQPELLNATYAAAPELLEALEKMTCRAEEFYRTEYEQEINNSEGDKYLSELEAARAAIARARGEA